MEEECIQSLSQINHLHIFLGGYKTALEGNKYMGYLYRKEVENMISTGKSFKI